MELELEQSQQGSSHEVSVSTEGVEELKRIVIHPYPQRNIMKSGPNRIERAIIEFMKFISVHQSVSVVLIYAKSWEITFFKRVLLLILSTNFNLVQVTVVLPLHNCKSGNCNDSFSGVDIMLRLLVACKPVESLLFETSVECWSNQKLLSQIRNVKLIQGKCKEVDWSIHELIE
nr:hypothetical protein [Tanacetum cinerariifolium]